MSSNHFYSSLPILERFLDIADPQHYVAIPDDWYIAITDIVQSSQAIAAGRYKDVNLIGASSILAVLNAANRTDVPFIFGGDGASFALPPIALAPCRDALLALRQLAQTRFDLDLRVGIVPVAHIRPYATLTVAKLQITPTYHQACFLGGGMTYATHLVKTNADYQLNVDSPAIADLTGLECRWQDIPSPYGHTISLIVTGLSQSPASREYNYRDVIQFIESTYGPPRNYRPITRELLKLSFSPRTLWSETKARSPSIRKRHRLLYLVQVFAQNLLGVLFMALRLTLAQVRWGEYKNDAVAASDYQKIDDVLRMVISGTPRQTQQLTQYLTRQYEAGRLAFGIHVSDRALMTCLILDRRDRHIHLVDAADGGYALAARQLKQRLLSRRVPG